MKVPKQRLYRAIYKSGLANQEQLKVINRKLGNDNKAQQRFLEVWRVNLGHRFIGSLNSFARWVVDHWDEIKIALGIVALFLDEEPENKKVEKKIGVPDYVAPPKPKKSDDVPVIVTNESIIPREVVESDVAKMAELERINKVVDEDEELERLIKEEEDSE